MTGIVKHEFTVEERPGERYRYLVTCVCGWQGRCGTLTEADQLGGQHLNHQSVLTANSGIRAGGL